MPDECRASGWLVVDKPEGLSSHRVVDNIRRAIGTKAGHAGTLDPLASGVLPVAIGEATKTIAYAMDGRKRYRFRIQWGVARTTDDREGEIVSESEARPNRAEIEAILPRFMGRVMQTPPAYSALKIAGRRAYALARAGRPPSLPPREVEIFDLQLVGIPDRIMPILRPRSARAPISAHSPATLPPASALSVISRLCGACRLVRLPKPMQFGWNRSPIHNICRMLSGACCRSKPRSRASRL